MPTYPSSKLPTEDLPIAQGAPSAVDSNAPMAYGYAVAMPTTTPTFEVPLPRGAGPGTAFAFTVDGRQHQMVVPNGVRPGMTLRCMIVPAGSMPGCDVLVDTPEGEMAVTVPAGMNPGEVLVVDLGTDLQQWVSPDIEIASADDSCCSGR